MDLEAALARVADLEGQVMVLTGERDDLTGRVAELDLARAELASAGERGLGYLRRALLAEQAGRIVPELVAGEDEAALLASVEVAKQAYARAVEGARVAIASQVVPAGAPSARAASAAGLSPLEMIESGLRR